MVVCIDKALALLKEAKRRMGGDKVLILSLSGSGLEEVDVSSLRIIQEAESQYVQVIVDHPALSRGQYGS